MSRTMELLKRGVPGGGCRLAHTRTRSCCFERIWTYSTSKPCGLNGTNCKRRWSTTSVCARWQSQTCLYCMRPLLRECDATNMTAWHAVMRSFGRPPYDDGHRNVDKAEVTDVLLGNLAPPIALVGHLGRHSSKARRVVY